MANVKISALPTASTPLTGAELVPIVQSGVTSQTTVSDFGAAVSYMPAGTGAVETTVQTKLRETVSVMDFGGVSGSDLSTALNAAIQALPALGGIVRLDMLSGDQYIGSRINLNKNNVTLLFGDATFHLSGVALSHDPVNFGAMFYCTAASNWIESSGGTVFRLADGEQATVLVFGIGGSGGVINVEFDGNKQNNTSQSDDTFQSGIQVISGPPSTTEVNVTIERCKIHDFNHYGIVTYGALSGKTRIVGNQIYNNGKNDALGTGDGIYINLGTSRTFVSENWVYGNKLSGIRLSSVGIQQQNNEIFSNWCYNNGVNGIWANEQPDVGSVANIGQSGLRIVGNKCNTNASFGIRVTTTSNVGLITNFIVGENIVYENSSGGVLIESNNSLTSFTGLGTINGNQIYGNTGDGLKLGQYVLDCVVSGNTCVDNTGTNLYDLGTRTVTYGNKTNRTEGVFVPGIPAFQAYLSANATNKTGNNAVATVICDAVLFDQKSNYNSSTGAFTAPATGKYKFTGRVNINSLTNAATTFLVQLLVSGTSSRTYQNLFLNTYPTLSAMTLQINETVVMTIGDTVTLQVLVNGIGANSAGFAGGSSPILTSFSGEFIC